MLPKIHSALTDINDQTDVSSRLFQSKIHARDLRESLISLVFAPLISYALYQSQNTLELCGWSMVAVPLLLGPLLFAWARQGPRNTDGSPRARLIRELVVVRRQISLLKTVSFWGVMPTCVGVYIAQLGHRYAGIDHHTVPLTGDPSFAVLVGLFFVSLIFNNVAVEKELAPRKRLLEAQLRHFRL